MSVAELLPGTGSVVPPGAVTVAVFANWPVAVLATVAVTTKVTVAVGAMVTSSLIEPLPEGFEQLAPAVAEQVHVAATSAAGRESATVAPTAVDGPALVTAIV